MTSILRLLRSRFVTFGCTVAAALALAVTLPVTAFAQKSFATPEAAMTAFGDALAHNDEATLRALFGANFRELLPSVDAEIRLRFLTQWSKSHTIQATDDKLAHIAVGDDGWTFPIPLVKTAGGWHFDTAAGAEEMRARRIGRNELAVIQTMLAVYDAQREYASTYHDGSDVLVYAAKLASSPGKHDGLYWPTGTDAPASPLGPAFLTAGTRNAKSAGYYGYHFQLLTSQGPHAPGGAYDYMVNGKLLGGFGVIAWPVRYRDTGIKTFMVNHQGQVYEQDLGPDSAAKAAAMHSFDPGPGWVKVSPEWAKEMP